MATLRQRLYQPLDNPSSQIRLIEILSQSPDEKLSSTDEGIADALSTFHRLFDALGTSYKTISGHRVPDLDGPEWAADVIEMKKVLITPHNASHFNQKDHTFIPSSLETFAQCPFWTRVWIQQEITLAPNVYYVCPTKAISHGKLYFTVDSIYAMLTERRYVREASLLEPIVHNLANALDRVYGRLLIRFLAHMPSQHSKVLARLKVLIDTFSGELEATRPVDYVYGLLRLSGLDMVPDYSRAAPDVWLELATKYLEIFQSERPELNGMCPAREFLEPHGILHFIQLCGAGLRRDQNLPTWAPVLTPLRRRQHRFPICKGSSKVYMGLLELQSRPDPRVVDNSLWVTAVKVQTVSTCDKEPLNIDAFDVFASTVATQFESFLATHGPTYVSGQPLLTVLSSTLFNQEDTESSLEMLYHILLMHNLITPRLSEQLIRDGLKRLPYEAVEHHFVEWTAKRGFFNGQKFICTEDGYIGLAGADVQEGDIICVIAHLNQPAILRPEGDQNLFVGCCFTLGLMKGRLLTWSSKGGQRL
ncbi:hypothetical protein B0J15DRAFT_523303 [Fusarium solani]|uniref:Heterokaryon incompatibility domain-containing protein n=1 Tax=Fusarium solani TaxID=169388 RepID=A0A9P9KUW2_FUSSL|nr:uncharacterized protein B0J15DRAFT_523303 [Fusarium solani]KAH7268887.1 hypothetical protein B0J15DRAFT_523303 [Fusarium solani]